MSQTYSIACKDCRQHVWIAQGSYSDKKKGRIYTGDKYKQLHFEFLIDHQGHHLVFGPNCEEPIADYEEIEI